MTMKKNKANFSKIKKSFKEKLRKVSINKHFF